MLFFKTTYASSNKNSIENYVISLVPKRYGKSHNNTHSRDNSSICRSSRPEVFCKKDVVGNFEELTGKHLCQSLFLIKVAGFRPATLLNRDSDAGVFLSILRNFKEHLFYRTPHVAASASGNSLSFFD